jgi:hypothetical protein
MQQSHGGVAGDNLLRRGCGAVVDDDDLKQGPGKSLCLEAAEAGLQLGRLIKMGNNN